jgi:hypothetical protein
MSFVKLDADGSLTRIRTTVRSSWSDIMSLLLATAYKAHNHYTRSQGYTARSSVPQDLQTTIELM